MGFVFKPTYLKLVNCNQPVCFIHINIYIIYRVFISVHFFKEMNLRHMGGSPGDVSEEPVTWKKRKKGWKMTCDAGEATEGWENEL